MYITEEAKALFLEAMRQIGKDVFHIELVKHGCGGKGLNMRLITKEEATRLIDVNGIAVDICEEDDAFLKEFTFEEYNGNIKVIPPANYQSGCHHDCNEQSCDECDCENCH